MNLRRFFLSAILLLVGAFFAHAAEPKSVASSYASQFLAQGEEFRFGAQKTAEESTLACYTFGDASVHPDRLNFGNVTIGQQKSLTFRIQNEGNGAEVRIDSIQSLNPRFQVTDRPALPFCLPNKQSVNVEVTFTPNSETELVSQIRIRHTNNDQVVVTSMVLVSGQGKQGAAVITVNPSAIDFGLVGVGQDLQKSFAIKNNGSVPATIQSVTSNNAAFSITSPSFPRNLDGGQSQVVNVRFQPTKAGNVSGKLSVVSNGQTVAVVNTSGSGGGNPDIAVNPSQLDYGQLEVGTFKELNLTISNTGNGTLQVQSFKFTDTAFEITPNGPADIPGNGSRAFKVKFVSSAKGAQTKVLTIQSNDPDEKTVQVSMTANVIGGKLGFSDKSISSRLRGNPIHTKGLQWVDFNKDDKVDLYIVGTNGNVICNNAGQSKFTNGTGKAKLGNNNQIAGGASWADVDNDGDLDVFIANQNTPSVVLRNNNGVFTKVQSVLRADMTAEEAVTQTEGGVWVDFNRDGRLDLYVVRDGAPNQLFKNTGIFNLVNVGASAKVDVNSTGRSAVVADFNNDNFPDIFVVNFNRPNKLYINNGNETFRDVSTSAGVGGAGPGQQAVVADYDQDGDTDLFVVNSGAASILYRNIGNLKFQKATAVAGLAGPKNAKSASFADYDNDGDDDLLLLQTPGGNIFFRNNGAGKFARIFNVDLDESDDPTSVVNGDFNNDGLIDVVIGDGDGGEENGDSIFINTGGEGNNFLIVTLEGTSSNRSAIGAKVLVRVGLIPQAKEVSAGNGKNQESLPLEFGLGGATQASSVQIFWPSGLVETKPNVPAGRVTYVEGQ